MANDQLNLLNADGRSTIRAEVRSVVYENAENGYAVVRVEAEGEPGVLTAVGLLGKVTPGEMLELTGRFVVHPKFGRQMEVEKSRQSVPATENGVARYLASGLIKGVGPKTAEVMVKRFGAAVFDILDNDPERLLELRGITRKKLAEIVTCWREHRAVKNLMVFLQEHEVPTTFAAKIHREYGDAAVAKLQENPYELAYVVRGIGFKTADAMALRLGLTADSPERMEAAVVYSLFSLSEAGHIYAPEEVLYTQMERMLGDALSELGFEKALARLEERKKIVVEDFAGFGIGRGIYLHHFYRAEQETTARLMALLSHPTSAETVKRAVAGLPALERSAGLELSDEQRQAVKLALEEKVLIVTGGPGTGKTTITRMIVEAFRSAGLKVKLAAPTGRAAKRLAESAGEQAQTLHRLLQYAPDQGFLLREENKLKAEALLVDEASMLDAQLFLAVLRALPVTSRLVLVGDVSQLPSVGPGNVLADLLTSECLPSVRLTRIYRQAMQSAIVVNAHRVNQGQMPVEDATLEPPAKDFFWVRQDEPLRVQQLIVQLVAERIPAIYGLDPRRDIQVLAPMHKGEVGTQALGAALQERLNPLSRAGVELIRGRNRFRPGDRVLQLRNNYEKDVFNGDLGFVLAVDPEAQELTVDFDGREVAFEVADLDELAPAYAISVHKSQGSEYPAVVVPVVTQHFIMLQRNLLYTALTRGRKLAVIIGGDKAVGIAVHNDKAEKRFTHLAHRLREAVNTLE